MATQPKSFITPEQYLEIERAAEFKSEYFQGEMFAMAGAREAHNLIVTNLSALLWQQFRVKPCRHYSNDMRVQVDAASSYTYPDVVVVCGEPRFLDKRRDTLLNPGLIVEVLSPSTEFYNRMGKFKYYRRLDSLNEYLLVASDSVGTELYTRHADGTWVLREANSLENSIQLGSVGATLRLSDIYEKVEFQAER